MTEGGDRPGKIVCVGRNYRAHAEELGNAPPPEPLLFFKPPSAVIPTGEAIVLPGWAGRIDFEGEIGVVIGRKGRRIAEGQAWAHVAGFVPVNDVTARELQTRDGQWARAKGFDTFCPIGPFVALDAVDPGTLAIVTTVNGEERQRGSVTDMLFPIPLLIAAISEVMTLEPGDLICTGTPAGVGPLHPGDEVEVSLAGFSSVRNPVRADELRR